MKFSELRQLIKLLRNPKFRRWVERIAFKIDMKQSMVEILKVRFR